MKLEEAKNGLKRFCEYENSIVLTDKVLYEVQEMIETVLQELDNSISKDKIREKKKQILELNTKRDETSQYVIDILDELLEDK